MDTLQLLFVSPTTSLAKGLAGVWSLSNNGSGRRQPRDVNSPGRKGGLVVTDLGWQHGVTAIGSSKHDDAC
jgi:hypothetical protein